MNIKLLIDRVINDETTIIKPSSILTIEEINKDPYLISAYYMKNKDIRLITPRSLIAEKIGDKEYPKVKRGEDIPEYAFDMILEQGRALIFIEPSSGYAILKQLNEKRFLTFGSKRALPFGLSNFVKPRPNECHIDRPFTYNDPILVVEGLRDCLDAQTIYPFTVATQTDAIPAMVKEVLHTLTTNIILGLDNDPPGIKAKRRLLYLKEFNYSLLQYPSGYKDIGTLSQVYFNSYDYNYFRTYLLSQLLILSNGGFNNVTIKY